MTSPKKWFHLLSAFARLRSADNLHSDHFLLLDTAMGSENSGDFVIMDACSKIASQIFDDDLPHLATHFYSDDLEKFPDYVKLLCGTNILYTHMADQKQWALSKDLSHNGNVCLFGVGMSDIGVDDSIDAYSKLFYKTILSRDYLHSVRDEMTRKRLLDIGIENVLNTACPTMWSLTPERQKLINSSRSKNVVCSITDYCFDKHLDLEMIQCLTGLYDNVTIWVQGSHDIDWCLDQIVDLDQFNVIGPNIKELDSFITDHDFDYIGTRLHAGIRCLNGLHRSLVISVDNRARQIGADTDLPVLERQPGFTKQIEDWVEHPVETKIDLPWDAICKWKEQFH